MHPTIRGRVVRVRVHLVCRRVKHAWHRLRNRDHRKVARIATVSHLSYYGLVFWESHGLYGKAALICGVILVVESVLGGGSHEE